MKNGFWVRYWMESGRGHSVVEETYVYIRYKDGYTEKDSFEEEAYEWAGHDMDGFNMMRFTSGFEIVEKPPIKWLNKELEETRNEQERLISYEKLIKSELGLTSHSMEEYKMQDKIQETLRNKKRTRKKSDWYVVINSKVFTGIVVVKPSGEVSQSIESD